MGRTKQFDPHRPAVAVRMPKELHERLRTTADERDTSVNHLMVKAAQAYLDRLPPLEPEEH